MSYKFVKEQNIIDETALLLRDEVRSIVVVGKYGNSVSTTSRRISETIKKTMDWISLECRYTDIPISVDEKTIMYIYGWFGLWNDDFCSVDKANNAFQSLIQILNETRNVKLILGMRSDLYKKYHQELNKADNQKTSLHSITKLTWTAALTFVKIKNIQTILTKRLRNNVNKETVCAKI